MNRFIRSALTLSAFAVLAACGGDRSDSVPAPSAGAPASISGLTTVRPDGGGVTVAAIDSRLRAAKGPVDVWVTLDQTSLARSRALLAESTGVPRMRELSAGKGETGARRTESAAVVVAAMNNQRARIRSQQAAASQRLSALGAVELGRVSVAHNAIAIRVDSSRLEQIAALPGVLQVRAVMNYELHLGETVPYVGGSAVQGMGYDGTGVTVAVLDSGVDYTHRNLGGPGTLAGYNDCYAQRDVAVSGNCAALFGPGAPKVIGGFDFVGETWPTDERTEDPNPIDFEGHGTHVADIIAGRSADGTHKGMAPGAKLLAVKVCSAVSSSCNGVALLKGVDFALDPNGDGDLSDAVDVMNLSLGSDYGQIEDDLTQALTNAVNVGVMVVASAGNGSDRPYKVGSPSIAPGVLSVAQTQVPSAVSIPLIVNSPVSIAGSYSNTATLAWAPIIGTTVGDVVYVGRACANPNDPLLANPAGKIALVLRGTCSISEKVDKASNAGAIGVLVMLSAPGDAQSFSQGGGSNFKPSLVIQQSLGNTIRTRLTAGETVTATMSINNAFALVGSIVSSSSRGPSMSTQGIKPEIGAPGASLSAEVGTGTVETAFGGTSGAAPMVAGAAALMVQAQPARSALEIKAMLMNSSQTQVFTSKAFYPGQLAPISRVGAGELRVNRAVALTGAAWDTNALTAALSFGALEVSQQAVVTRTLTIQNFSGSAKQYSIASSFRYADDEATGAVRVQAPSTVDVPANGAATIDVTLVINPLTLPTWNLNGGSQGGNGQLLNGPEYDGYITLMASGETLSVPWHVLPRKAARTYAAYSATRGASLLTLVNTGAEGGVYDVFSLVGSSAQLAGPLPAPGSNEAVVDLRSIGVRYLTQAECGVTGGCLQFAINTFGRRAHPLYPGGIEIDVDTNGDGVADTYVFQSEFNGFGATGQSVVNVQSAATGATSVFFFNTADLNSGNSIFTLPLSALGTSVTPSTTLSFDAFAYDNYFTGRITDAIVGMKFTPSAPKFSPASKFGSVARGTSSRISFTKNAINTQNTELGLLLMYGRNAGNESQEIRP